MSSKQSKRQTSTQSERVELLHSTMCADDSPNRETSSDELLTRERYENTPFYIIGNDENGYFLAFGRYRLSEALPTVEEVKTYVKENMWNVNMRFIITLQESVENFKQQG